MKDKSTLVGVIVFIAFQCWFVPFMLNKQSEKSRKKADYITKHECVVTGFAGKNPDKVFTCKTGVFLEDELWRQE